MPGWHRRPQNVVRGQVDVQQGVSTWVTGTDLRSTSTVGTPNCWSWTFNAFWAHSRNSCSVVPFSSNVLHSTAEAATNILVPGFTVHSHVETGGPKRRNRAAEVVAAAAGEEGVLGFRCLKDRRPHLPEIVIQLLHWDGGGGGCAQAERHRNE